jgi:hypothetical protein
VGRSGLVFFSQLHILKGFKSCVLKVRIPKGLQSYFPKVRIVRMLAMRDERRDKEKDNAETLRAQRFRREDGAAVHGVCYRNS